MEKYQLEWKNLHLSSCLELGTRGVVAKISNHFQRIEGKNLSLRLLLEKEERSRRRIESLLKKEIQIGGKGSREKGKGKEKEKEKEKERACQWRPVSSFRKGCFFNICLPQIPSEFQ